MKAKTIFKNLLVLTVLYGAYSFTIKREKLSSEEISLKVKISGIKTTDGNIHVLLYNKAPGYPTNYNKAYRHLKCKATKGEISISIDKITAGTYSIVAFHDINANEQFDKSWLGSPKEDYGFSNIPGEYCGTPSFQQTSFVVSQLANSVSVKLMNMD